MKSICLAVIALTLASLGHTRPNVIDEWARLPLPTDRNWQSVGSFGVAIDGDWALVSAIAPCPECEFDYSNAAALLYHYTAGSWQYQGILGGVQQMYYSRRPGLAMKNGIAVISLE